MSTTYTAARDALVSKLETYWSVAHPTVPLFYENAESVDMDTVGDSFIRVQVAFEVAKQASIESVPMQRVVGHLYMLIYSKFGHGTRGALTYLEDLSYAFKHLNISGVQIGTPTPGHRESHNGWFMQELAIPFWFHVA